MTETLRISAQTPENDPYEVDGAITLEPDQPQTPDQSYPHATLAGEPTDPYRIGTPDHIRESAEKTLPKGEDSWMQLDQ